MVGMCSLRGKDSVFPARLPLLGTVPALSWCLLSLPGRRAELGQMGRKPSDPWLSLGVRDLREPLPCGDRLLVLPAAWPRPGSPFTPSGLDSGSETRAISTVPGDYTACLPSLLKNVPIKRCWCFTPGGTNNATGFLGDFQHQRLVLPIEISRCELLNHICMDSRGEAHAWR